MKDWSDGDRELFAAVNPVVAALSGIVSADQIMVVGAQCRDLLNWRFGSRAPRRSTGDTDVALALEDWDQFNRIRETFRSLGSTGHRFLIADVPTDVVPFGSIEAPAGTSHRLPDGDPLNVHGFADAYERSDRLQLPTGAQIRIPRPEGFAVLKTHAWLDRSAQFEYRDGPDLALAVHWYAEDLDRIYAGENLWAFDQYDFDVPTTAGALVGRDMRNALSSNELAVLTDRLREADRDLLAHNFHVASPHWPRTDTRLRPIVDATIDEFLR